jgi:UDP-glucuronate 4-epimerase
LDCSSKRLESAIQRDHGFEPSTTIDEGVPRFVDWFKRYHRID